MQKYNLGFIDDQAIFNCVEQYILKYLHIINEKKDLDGLNENVIDPIKLTFDSKVLHKNNKILIEYELNRQIDKSINNYITIFHKNIINSIIIYKNLDYSTSIDWFDFLDTSNQSYFKIRNKHNTHNNDGAKSVFTKMEEKIKERNDSICYLVEVISEKSRNEIWEIEKKKKISNPNIRIISIDNFYHRLTNDQNSFINLCKTLPIIIDDVIKDKNSIINRDSIIDAIQRELSVYDSDLISSLYKLSFSSYSGIEHL